MAEAEAPVSPVIDLHTNSIAAVMNENSSTASIDAASLDANNTNGSGGVATNLQCPATPQLIWKLSDLSSNSSESDNELPAESSAVNNDPSTVELAVTSSSPPPNCAICLGRCKNKCFTDSCMHQFCFKCLCEWSKVKPECPLCKQTFKSIIHNVKSIDQFEEYHVQPPTVQIPQRPMFNYRHLPYFVDLINPRNNYSDYNFSWNGPRVAHRTMRTGRSIYFPLTAGGASASGSASNGGAEVQTQFINRGELLDMYRQEFPEAVATNGTLSQLWRRYVYDRKLYALPVSDVTGRYRESSARFYRENPVQIHRLMPWINRDIVCLLRNTEHSVTDLLNLINESLQIQNIYSPGFRRRLQPYLGSKTAHFIHELNNFARSPYDMIGYDRAVQYSPQSLDQVIVDFSSSSSDDGENAGFRQRTHAERVNQYRLHTRSSSNGGSNSANGQQPLVNLLSFTISTTSEGSEAPGVTVAVSGRGAQSAAINLTTHNRAGELFIDLDDTELGVSVDTNNSSTGNSNIVPPGVFTMSGTAQTNSNTATTSTTATNGVVSSSITMSTNASTATTATGSARTTSTITTAATTTVSSSSARVHPTPTVTDHIEISTSSSDECEFVLERKPPHLRTPEMVSLNSESDSDVVFVTESKPLRNTTFSTDENENPTRMNLRGTKEKSSRSSKVKNEIYNIGASTSTGLRSSERKRAQQNVDAVTYALRKKQRQTRSERNSQKTAGGQEPSSRAKSLRNHSESSQAYSTMSPTTHSASDTDDDNDSEFEAKKKKNPKRKNSDKRSNKRVTKQRGKKRTSCTQNQNKSAKRQKMSPTATRTKLDTDLSTDTDDDAVLSLTMLKKRLHEQQEKQTERISSDTMHCKEMNEQRPNQSEINTSNSFNITQSGTEIKDKNSDSESMRSDVQQKPQLADLNTAKDFSLIQCMQESASDRFFEPQPTDLTYEARTSNNNRNVNQQTNIPNVSSSTTNELFENSELPTTSFNARLKQEFERPNSQQSMHSCTDSATSTSTCTSFSVTSNATSTSSSSPISTSAALRNHVVKTDIFTDASDNDIDDDDDDDNNNDDNDDDDDDDHLTYTTDFNSNKSDASAITSTRIDEHLEDIEQPRSSTAIEYALQDAIQDAETTESTNINECCDSANMAQRALDALMAEVLSTDDVNMDTDYAFPECDAIIEDCEERELDVDSQIHGVANAEDGHSIEGVDSVNSVASNQRDDNASTVACNQHINSLNRAYNSESDSDSAESLDREQLDKFLDEFGVFVDVVVGQNVDSSVSGANDDGAINSAATIETNLAQNSTPNDYETSPTVRYDVQGFNYESTDSSRDD